METIIKIIVELDAYLSGHPVFVATLLGTGLFFTIYLGFPQIRFFKKAVRIVMGKHDKDGTEGDASHFQALATALSGTVGTGNIAGVALAIHLGGPAALFWMMVTALIGMATKFVEVTLSHKYRVKLPDGTMAGGPMFYMRERLNIKLSNGKVIKTGQWIAMLFAVCTLVGAFGTGCLPQVNSISSAMFNTFGIPQMAVGGILALILALVILGGIKRIVKVTEKLVPIMGIAYFVGALVVVIYHYDNIIPGIISIFSEIWTGPSAVGGFVGASAAFALSRGVNRGLFSNEAGQGSAPIAHAAARCEEPAAEGLVALLEPFIDTVIICMLTGTMIIASGVWHEKYENKFQQADMLVLNSISETPDEIRGAMADASKYFDGMLMVKNGQIADSAVMVIHAHSVAEEMKVISVGMPYDGVIKVSEGVPTLKTEKGDEIEVYGKSLLHSAPLTIKAFSSSWFGDLGQYIVALSLMLFAFSTTIAWSYYGDRASVFIWGPKSVVPFRMVYVIIFFIGSFTDTAIVWSVASIGIVLMSMPNLIGLLILHREMKQEMKKFMSSEEYKK